MAFRELTAHGTKELEQEEGKVPYIYDDAVSPTRMWSPGTPIKGNLTAGVGHLLSKGNNIFPEAKAWYGRTIPEAQILVWLDADTDVAEQAVDRLVKVELPDSRWDVLFRSTFNIGVNAFAGSTLLKKVNAGKFNEVPAELAKWVNTTIGGKKVKSAGLVARYAHEGSLWAGSTSKVTLDTPAPTQPMATEIAERDTHPTSPLEIATGVGIPVVTAATGFANATGPVAWAFFGLAVLGGLIFAAVVIKRQFFSA